MTVSLDQSAFMVTYSGVKFTIFDPQIEDIQIEDIAHALSQLCRFTGHTRHFYSVAEHAYLASKLVPPSFALEALLHDAAEAYCNDLSRPMKHHPRLTGYTEVEEIIDRAVRQKFGLPASMSPEVKDVDNKLVCTEGVQLMKEHAWAEGHPRYDFLLSCLNSSEAEMQFIDRFNELTR